MTKQKPEGQLLDHNYDNIQELDNPLPRWWIYLFIGSILISAVYIGYLMTGSRSIQDNFERHYAKATKVTQAVESSTPQAPLEFLHDESTLADGKAVYDSRCAACHGKLGEGLVGPNLTDAHWINGDGTLEAIKTVIVDGVPAKGMMAWGNLLSEEDIMAVTSYIGSIQGSNPPNGKGPEGPRYEQSL